jgi:hypothetical protein
MDRNFIKDFVKKHKYEIILSIISLLPFWWFKDGYPRLSGDSGFYLLKPFFSISVNFFCWNPLISTGSSNMAGLLTIPFYLFESALRAIGLPYFLIQATIYSGSLMLGSISFYSLISYLGKHYKMERAETSAFWGAVFLIFNPYTIYYFGTYYVTYLIVPIFSLLFLFYTKGLLQKKYLKYSILLSLSSAALSVNFINPVHLPSLILVIFGFLIFHLALERFRKTTFIEILKFNGILFGIFVITNLWWIWPYVLNLKDTYMFGYSGSNLSDLEIRSQMSNFLNVIRLFAWDSPNLAISILAAIIPLCVLISVYLNRKSKLIYYFFGLSIIGIFLSKGISPPFGSIFLYLFNNVPGFQAFRNPYDKFGILIALPYSALIGFLFGKLSFILARNRRHISIAITTICFAVFLFVANPLLTGQVLISGDFKDKVITQVPGKYYEASKFININPDFFRIYQLPLNLSLQAYYNWEHGYVGVDPTPVLYERPVIFQSLGPPYEEIYPLMCSLIEGYDTNFIKLANWLNIKYFSIDKSKDGISNSKPMDEWLADLTILFKSTGLLNHARDFENLSFYEYTNFRPNSEIFFPSELVYVQGSSESLKNILKLENDVSQSAFIFSVTEGLKDVAKNEVINRASKVYISYFSYDNSDFRKLLDEDKGFYVPVNGNYDVYLCLDENLKQLLSKKEDIKIIFAGKDKISKNKLIRSTDEYLYFGDRKLSKGIYDIKVKVGDDTYSEPSILKNILLVETRGEPKSTSASYEKINNTKYRLDGMKNVEAIMLNQTYHRFWNISNPDAYYHIKANGYANLWIAKNNADLRNSGTSYITYSPQRFFIIGGVISSISIIGFLLLYILRIRKYKRTNYF